MAKKEPETTNRFRVWAEVPKEQLGDVVVAFTQLGLQQIGHEMITDVHTFKQTKRFDTNSADHLRAWIKDHPTFTASEVREHFGESGRSKDSAYGAIYMLVKEKEIKKLGEGNYQRADVKAITGPKKAKAPRMIAPKKKGSQPGRKPTGGLYDVSNVDILLAKYRNRQKFTVREAEAYFEDQGRPKKSVWPVVHKLEAAHKLRKIAAGEYAVVKIKLKPRQIAAKKLNGAAASEAHTEEGAGTNG